MWLIDARRIAAEAEVAWFAGRCALFAAEKWRGVFTRPPCVFVSGVPDRHLVFLLMV
jgi:hypothetical protein